MTVLAVAKQHLDDSKPDAWWSLIDPKLLTILGWDEEQVLSFPQDDPMLGWTTCKVTGCPRDGRVQSGLCGSCAAQWRGIGSPPLEKFLENAAPCVSTVGFGPCAVKDCQRPWKSASMRLCDAHHLQRMRLPQASVEDFLAHPGIVPHLAFGPCDVLACTRDREGNGSYCKAHRQRLDALSRREPRIDLNTWSRRESAIPELGKASLRGLPSSLIAEVIFGIQERAQKGSRVHYFEVRVLCDKARLHDAASLTDIPPGVLSVAQGKLCSSFLKAARRARSTPETERHKDIWDLAVFGQGGTLSFTNISQPWLKEAAKRWVLEDLPQRRGLQVPGVNTVNLV